jgi:hypothetical protein
LLCMAFVSKLPIACCAKSPVSQSCPERFHSFATVRDSEDRRQSTVRSTNAFLGAGGTNGARERNCHDAVKKSAVEPLLAMSTVFAVSARLRK